MSPPLNSRLIQVTNIAPTATKEHMRTLFGYLGRMDELKLFPPDDSPLEVSSRVCYVRYDNSSDASTACHLTNTVFIDRALIIVPVEDGRIPDEATAMFQAAPPGTVAGVLPTSSTWPITVVNQVIGTNNGQQIIMTRDPELTKRGLPPYPPLPATMDATKIDEIRRTIMVENLAPTTMPDQLMKFFNQVGEIKYVRMASMASESTGIALVEFSIQPSVPTALTYNGGMFNGRTIKVIHSTCAIIKPMPKMEVPNKEIEEAMKKVKEAQSLISGAVDSEYRATSESKRNRNRSRSGSRTRSPRRRRSRSRSRRDRSRDRRRRSVSRPKVNPKPVDRPRRRSRSPRRKSRTRSPPRRRSGSRSRRHSKSPRRRKSRSRSKRRRSRRSRSRSLKKRKSRSGSPSAKAAGKNGSPERKSGSPKRKAGSKSPRRSKRRSRTRSPKRRRSRSDSRSRKNRKDRKRSRSRDRKKKDRSPEPETKPLVKRDDDAREKSTEVEEKKKVGPATPPDMRRTSTYTDEAPAPPPTESADVKVKIEEIASEINVKEEKASSEIKVEKEEVSPAIKVKKQDNLQQEDMEVDSNSE